MKKLFVLAASALLLSACAKENIKPNEPADQNGERPLLEIGLNTTKTALRTEAAGKFPIVWSEGDEIAVIDNMGVEGKQNISVYRIKEGIGTDKGLFEHVSGDAFPKVINDVVYPASAVDPKTTLISETTDLADSTLVPKVQNQAYTKDSFDPKYAVMRFHRNSPSEPIKLSPISTIVCIPIKGFGDNDVVTSVKWQNFDSRTVDITLNCPTGGVKLSKNQATNFYLSIPPTKEKWNTFNSIVYVYLKNGAVQVQTPRNRNRFEAGTLHRFPEWQLSKKAEWTIMDYGSQRNMATWKGIPLGPAYFMIDGNDLSWWESRRELKPDNSGPKMAGPHTMVIDLGKAQTISTIKVKSKEIDSSPLYGIVNNKGEDIYGKQSYNPPFTYHVAFATEEPTEAVISSFIKNKTWPTGLTKKTFKCVATNGMDSYYGKDKKSWWTVNAGGVEARYLFVHFEHSWNNDANGTAAPFVKVAEFDIE